MYMDEIIGDEKIEDLDTQIEIVAEVWDELARLAENQDYVSLNETQKFIYIANMFFMEVNNGGFSQYFFNETGDFAIDTLDALDEMKFFKASELLEKAMQVFEQGYIYDRFLRQDYTMGENEEEIEKILGALDEEFYETEHDVDLNLYDYIFANKDQLDV